MRSAVISIATALVVAACTGETDYDVLDDYNATSSDPTVASKAADAGPRATSSRGTDAGAVAQRPGASAPPAASPPPADPSPPPPPKKKKGKDHGDD